MALIEKLFYRIKEVTSEYDCTKDDILCWAEEGLITLSVYVNAVIPEVNCSYRFNPPQISDGIKLGDFKDSMIFNFESKNVHVEGYYNLSKKDVKSISHGMGDTIEINTLFLDRFTEIETDNRVKNFTNKSYPFKLRDSLKIDQDNIMIFLNQLDKIEDLLGKFDAKLSKLDYNELPEELKIVIDLYLNYWLKIPDGQFPLKREDLLKQIQKKYSIGPIPAKRVYDVSKPAIKDTGRKTDDVTFFNLID